MLKSQMFPVRIIPRIRYCRFYGDTAHLDPFISMSEISMYIYNVHLPTRYTSVMAWPVSGSQVTWDMSSNFSSRFFTFDVLSILIILSVLFYIAIFVFLCFPLMYVHLLLCVLHDDLAQTHQKGSCGCCHVRSRGSGPPCDGFSWTVCFSPCVTYSSDWVPKLHSNLVKHGSVVFRQFMCVLSSTQFYTYYTFTEVYEPNTVVWCFEGL